MHVPERLSQRLLVRDLSAIAEAYVECVPCRSIKCRSTLCCEPTVTGIGPTQDLQ
jgi:hypothetical protein